MGSIIDQHLGRKISEARRFAERSVSELATEIDVTPDHLEKMERGHRRIDALSLARCSKALNRPLKWFYAGLPGQSKFENSKP